MKLGFPGGALDTLICRGGPPNTLASSCRRGLSGGEKQRGGGVATVERWETTPPVPVRAGPGSRGTRPSWAKPVPGRKKRRGTARLEKKNSSQKRKREKQKRKRQIKYMKIYFKNL